MEKRSLTIMEKLKLFLAASAIIIIIVGTYMRVQQEREHQILFEQYKKEHFQNLLKNKKDTNARA